MPKSIHHTLSRTLFGLSIVFSVTTAGYVIWNYQYAERAAMRATVYRDYEKHTQEMGKLEQIYRKQEEDIIKEKSSNQ